MISLHPTTMANGIPLILGAIFVNTILAQSIVKISEGFVSGGKTETRQGREILAFEGIPYGEPPTGSLRFRSPVPKKPWSGIFMAQKLNEGCVQSTADGIIGVEDCLTLNVYTRWPLDRSGAPLAVMVYIHGGGYTTGIANRVQTGPDYLLDRDIVLVTINYRLGILGFLSSGDSAAPGNFGLKDQWLALKWVQRNILAFGGDPNRVTIFGESAGSSCVHLHSLSEKSKPLFQRYIMQSGSVLHTWAFRSDPSYYEKSKDVAKLYNCTTANSFSMVDCLRKLTTTQLINSTSVFDLLSQILLIGWGPTIEPKSDDAFLSENPFHIMQKNQMANRPLITGSVQNEALYFFIDLYLKNDTYNFFASKPIKGIRQLLEYYEPARQQNLTELAVKISNFYLGNEIPQDKETFLQKYLPFVTDLLFFYPQSQLSGYLLRQKREFYLYTFNYMGAISLSYWTAANESIGVDHGDDLIYLFPISASSIGSPDYFVRTPDDFKMVNFMVDFWSTFSQTSVPFTQHASNPFIWKPCRWHGTKEWDMTNLQIGNNSDPTLSMQSSFFEKRMQFWYDNVRQYPLYSNS